MIRPALEPGVEDDPVVGVPVVAEVPVVSGDAVVGDDALVENVAGPDPPACPEAASPVPLEHAPVAIIAANSTAPSLICGPIPYLTLAAPALVPQ
jgi:hypothetical protein